MPGIIARGAVETDKTAVHIISTAFAILVVFIIVGAPIAFLRTFISKKTRTVGSRPFVSGRDCRDCAGWREALHHLRRAQDPVRSASYIAAASETSNPRRLMEYLPFRASPEPYRSPMGGVGAGTALTIDEPSAHERSRNAPSPLGMIQLPFRDAFCRRDQSSVVHLLPRRSVVLALLFAIGATTIAMLGPTAALASATRSGLTSMDSTFMSATSSTSDPIVGDWLVTYGNTTIVAMSYSSGVYTETATEPLEVAGSSCYLPPGTVIATFSGSGTSYSGQHGLWYTSNCSFAEWTSLELTLAGDTLTGVLGSGGEVVFTRVVPPRDITPPTATGQRKAGNELTCSTGSWTNDPTSYTYQWYRNGTLLAGFTGPTYALGTLDEGTTLTCTVTASNAAGQASAMSNAVKVPMPYVRRCPGAAGRMTGTTIGQIQLGMTRSQARYLYRQHSNRGKQYEDFFCLTPIGVRVGYASPKLLKGLSRRERAEVRGTVVWSSTSDPFYSLDGIRAGESIATASLVLGTEPPFHIGLNYWYLARKTTYTAVLKVRGRVVDELGIADNALTTSRGLQSVLMHSFD